MERKVSISGFDTWMLETVHSVHYLKTEQMERAHDRLEKPTEVRIDYIKNNNNVINTTPKRKIYRMFKNPFSKQKVSN